MLRYFQSAYLSRYIFVFVATLIYWAPSYFVIQSEELTQTAFFALPVIEGYLFFLLLTIFMVIAFLTALLTNQIAAESGFTGRISTVTLFIFILFSSSLPSFTSFTIFILANFIFVFLIRLLYLIPASNNPIFLTYNASLLLGAASLLYLPLVLLTPLVWIALLTHRSNDIRNYIASVTGLITPFLFTFIWFFWIDRLDDFILKFETLFQINPGYILSLDALSYAILFVIIVLTLISVLKATARLTEKNINQRRNIIITLYFQIFITILALLYGPSESVLLIICIPASLLVSHSLQQIRSAKPYNLVIVTLAILVLINQYMKLLP